MQILRSLLQEINDNKEYIAHLYGISDISSIFSVYRYINYYEEQKFKMDELKKLINSCPALVHIGCNAEAVKTFFLSQHFFYSHYQTYALSYDKFDPVYLNNKYRHLVDGFIEKYERAISMFTYDQLYPHRLQNFQITNFQTLKKMYKDQITHHKNDPVPFLITLNPGYIIMITKLIYEECVDLTRNQNISLYLESPSKYLNSLKKDTVRVMFSIKDKDVKVPKRLTDLNIHFENKSSNGKSQHLFLFSNNQEMQEFKKVYGLIKLNKNIDFVKIFAKTYINSSTLVALNSIYYGQVNFRENIENLLDNNSVIDELALMFPKIYTEL